MRHHQTTTTSSHHQASQIVSARPNQDIHRTKPSKHPVYQYQVSRPQKAQNTNNSANRTSPLSPTPRTEVHNPAHTLQMYFTTTALFLTAAVPLALSSPILEARQNGVTCQTSSGSPTTGDVTDVINQIRGQGGMCPQKNDEASGKPPTPNTYCRQKKSAKTIAINRLHYARKPQRGRHLRLRRR